MDSGGFILSRVPALRRVDLMSLVALNRIGWRLADSIAWHRVYVGLEEPYRGSLILHGFTPYSRRRRLSIRNNNSIIIEMSKPHWQQPDGDTHRLANSQ